MRAVPKKHVIVVGEDDLAIANLLRDALNDEPDISAVVANDGARVLETLRQVKADLLILDNMMPGLKGLDVLDRLRADVTLAGAPVLFVTAALAGAERDFERRGVSEVILKPFDLNELLQRVRFLLDTAVRARG